jgi:hypothetical protein
LTRFARDADNAFLIGQHGGAMEKHEAILADLEQLRESAAALIRTKVDAVGGQIRDLSSRALGDLSAVIPPDLETLFPIAALAERLKEMTKPAAPVGASLEVIRRLDAGRAQSEVLQELLRQIGAWCGPRAIVVLRDGYAQGWASAGFPGLDPARGWRGALADSGALQRAADGTPVITRASDDPVLGGWFDGSDGRLLLVPMSLRGKVVGVLLALEGEAGLDAGVVQQLTYTVGLMLETLGGRTSVPTAALREPEEMVGAAVAAPGVETAPAPELFEVEETPSVPPEITPAVADASATVHLKVPVAPAPPVVPPPPPPARPARSPEEERKHEEARRFARLLVSEIRLYNEQAVQAGKVARDIYQRLKDDIDRSREMYEQRVSLEVRSNSNYFFDELVRILADGEPDALGM